MNTNNTPYLNTSPLDREEVAWFECLDETGLALLPVPEFAVDGFVLAGRPTILYGQAYTGKSIIALDMALSISAGREWNGRRIQEGLSFYVTGERVNGVKKRVAAWRKHQGLDHPERFFLIGHPVLLDDAEQQRRLIATIQRKVKETGAPAQLVVFDSLSKCLGQTDENDAADATRVLKAAESICEATGAAVLLVHQSSRHGEVRGSTVMQSDPAGLLWLEGQSGSKMVKLRATKVRDFGRSEMTLRCKLVTLEELPDQDGEPSTSVVFVCEDSVKMPENKTNVSHAGTKANHPNRLAALSDRETATWQALIPLCTNLPKGVTSSTWEAAARKMGVSSASFSRAKRKLIDRGQVTSDAPGKVGARYAPVA